MGDESLTFIKGIRGPLDDACVWEDKVLSANQWMK